MEYEKIKIPVQVKTVSLVGIQYEQFPYPYGNYFSMECDGRGDFIGLSVCNFNFENFEEAKQRFLADGQVEVMIMKNNKGYEFIAIADERIPRDWYCMWSEQQGYCNGGIHGEVYQEVARTLGKRFGGDENYVYVKPEPQTVELTENDVIDCSDILIVGEKDN